MTSEAMERAMQFILEQQAQFSANIQKHDERLDRIEESVAGLTAIVEKGNQAIASLTRPGRPAHPS